MVQIIVRCQHYVHISYFKGQMLLTRKTTRAFQMMALAELHTFIRNHERITNEANALRLVSEKTTIPVPQLIDHGIHPDGRQYLITKRIHGTLLSQLGQDVADVAYANALNFIEGTVLPQLKNLRSNERGIHGFVMPPCWLSPDVDPPWKGKASWKTLPLNEPGYVFQHGDIAAHNIIMDTQTLQVVALIDWEYAGFFPPGMERWPGTLDQNAYNTLGKDLAKAISTFLPEEYLECYDRWNDKAELESLIQRGEIPDPQLLR